MACDMIVTGESGRFGEPEIRYGSGPVTLLMPFILGQKKTNELLFTGDMIDAAAAERAGMVNRVVADEQVEAEVEGLVRKIAPTPLPVLRLTKIALVRAYEAMGLREAVNMNLDLSSMLNAADMPEQREFMEIVRVTGPEGGPRLARRRYGEVLGGVESMSVTQSTIDPTRLAQADRDRRGGLQRPHHKVAGDDRAGAPRRSPAASPRAGRPPIRTRSTWSRATAPR